MGRRKTISALVLSSSFFTCSLVATVLVMVCTMAGLGEYNLASAFGASVRGEPQYRLLSILGRAPGFTCPFYHKLGATYCELWLSLRELLIPNVGDVWAIGP